MLKPAAARVSRRGGFLVATPEGRQPRRGEGEGRRDDSEWRGERLLVGGCPCPWRVGNQLPGASITTSRLVDFFKLKSNCSSKP
jgi:hypothetical protein